ncbi:MAG TPA: POTRA domain-containing protein [Pyrinomonadaceae bacterium]|nr:POTRA domain-containing protein [Pyrinomonadaceae bacterium]
MQTEKVFSFVFTFIFLFSTQLYAQSSQQIKILNNYEGIPFENGKTIISEIIFLGLDKEYKSESNLIYENDLLKDLRSNKVQINSGDVFYGYKVSNTVKFIRTWLTSKGYDKAEINAFGEGLPENKMRLIIVIKRGKLATISEIHFEGNKMFSELELQKFLKSEMEERWKIWDKRIYDYFTQKSLREFYFSKGYLKAKIKNVIYQSNEKNSFVLIEIEENTPFQIGEIELKGATVFTNNQILEMLGQKTGDVANAKGLRAFLYEKLKKVYNDRGYLLYDADIDPEYSEPKAKGQNGIVNLKIMIDEGTQFRIRRIEIVCPELLKIPKIRALLGLTPREIYSEEKLKEGIKRINKTKDFQFIDDEKDVELRTIEAGLLDLIVKIGPKLKGQK